MCNWVAFAQTGVQCTSVHKARGLQAPLQGRWCSRLVQFATPTSQHPAPKAARRPGVFSQLQSFDVASLLALFRLSADALPGGRPQSSRRCGRRSARSFKACMWHHRIAAHRSAFARQKTKGIRGSDLDCTTRGLHHARFLFSAKNGGTKMRASISSATLKAQGLLEPRLSRCLRLLCLFQPACSNKNGLHCSGQIQGH